MYWIVQPPADGAARFPKGSLRRAGKGMDGPLHGLMDLPLPVFRRGCSVHQLGIGLLGKIPLPGAVLVCQEPIGCFGDGSGFFL